MDISGTYFGFTSNMTPMQRGKAEKSLDMSIRYNGSVMTEKEFVYAKLLEGYLPDKEENYSYWSRRTGGMTKPKTLYMLRHPEKRSHTESTKTSFMYAQHLLDNGFLNAEVANRFIQNELFTEQEALRKAQEEKDRLRAEKEKERQQRKMERERLQQESLNQGRLIIHARGLRGLIDRVFTEHWESLKPLTGVETPDLVVSQHEYIARMIASEEAMKGRLHYLFHDLPDYASGKVDTLFERVLWGSMFGVKESDSKQTITAKVKAWYDGREYKGSKPVEKVDFYALVQGQFEKRTGEKVKIAGLTCFVSKDNGSWGITEGRSGASLGQRSTSKAEAIEKAKQGAEKNKDTLNRAIERTIEKFGLSPLYTQ